MKSELHCPNCASEWQNAFTELTKPDPRGEAYSNDLLRCDSCTFVGMRHEFLGRRKK